MTNTECTALYKMWKSLLDVFSWKYSSDIIHAILCLAKEMLCNWFSVLPNAPVTQDGDQTVTTLWPRESTRSPCDHQMSEKRPCVWLQYRDSAALTWHSDARPLWAQLGIHYNLCISATLIPQPHGTQDTCPLRSSATVSDQNAT